MNLPPRLPQAIAAFLAVAVVLPLVTAGTTLAAILFLPLPTPDLPPPKPGIDSRVTHIYAADGTEIGILRKFETSIPVQRSDIPNVLKQAVVAEEDQRFYSHGGVDIKAAFRALWADISGSSFQGGSTITQQYVKNAYTTGERTLARKLREALLASKLERKLSKDEILYRYLDNIYLGGGAYGVGAAAESYFRIPVNQLNLSQSAMLAGLISSPSTNEPRSNPTRAEAKREAVLKKMLDQGRIDQAQYNDALAQRIFIAGNGEDPPPGPATIVQPLELQSATYPYFVDAVRRYLIARYGDDVVYRGGLRVETSLDPKLQALAEATVAQSLKGTSAPLDMAMVSIDPTTGLVKAIVGGRDFNASQVNLALGSCPATDTPPAPDQPVCLNGGGTGRQPGSAFKPFTLAKAFEEGIGPERVYSGPSSYTFPGCSGSNCTVHNVESEAVGAVTLRTATALSVNTVFAQLIGNVGVKETAEMAHRLGLTTIDPNGRQPNGEPYGASLTLGAAEVSPYDMAAAYGVFANHGLQLPASPVVRVLDANGKVIEDNTNRHGKQVVSPAIADNVTDVLKGVIASGTGTAADIGRPNAEAGKTGTTENFGDAWFVGFTPVLSTAVWMGYADKPRPLTGINGVAKVYGGTIPAQTWHNYMSKALDGVDFGDFPPPEPLSLQAAFAPGEQKMPPTTEAAANPYIVVGPPLPPTGGQIPNVTLPGSLPTTTTTTTKPQTTSTTGLLGLFGN